MQHTHDSEPYPSVVNNVLVVDPSQAPADIVPIQVVTSRDRYQCCHIRFGDSSSGEFYAAICFEDNFYSLCFTKVGEEEAFNAAMQLTDRGRSIVITKIPKGYAVWVFEPDAIPSSSRVSHGKKSHTRTLEPRKSPHSDQVAVYAQALTRGENSTTLSSKLTHPDRSNHPEWLGHGASKPGSDSAISSDTSSKELMPYRVLTANDHHQLCRIYLPQLQQPCLCICLEHHYYKLFKTVETPHQAAKLVKLLTHYNEQIVMTKMPEGYGIWRLIDQQLLAALRGSDNQEPA
ncbi:MAG: hypothetical protein VKJ64_01715 [Leptolyngbyaceae bacterium]|nr:hypothetical protein [Leptolyngbyaceae bacterium]